jgi:hypothetical protein
VDGVRAAQQVGSTAGLSKKRAPAAPFTSMP